MTSLAVRISVALAVTFFLASGHQAAAAQPQPGQWRVTTKMSMTGMPPGMPGGMGAQENTQTQCVTPEQARDPKNWKEPEGAGGQNCTSKRDWNGTVLTIESTCRGNPPTTMKGTITFDTPTRYRGVMNSSMQTGGTPMQMTITMDGQRIGECPR